MSKRRIDGSESDSSLDSDTDWTIKRGKAKGGKPGKTNRANKKSRQLSSSDESDEDFAKDARGSPEEGEVSSSEHADGSESDSDDLADEPYEDGLNDDLVGDETDRQQLADMTEKEREEELFRRAERRDMLKSRREIELKLKQARKREERKRRHAESGKSPSKSGKRTESATGSAKQTDKTANSGSRRRALEEKNAEQKRRMQELRAKREERMRKEKERKDEELRAAEANEAVSKTRLRTSDVFSDAESDSEDSEKRPGARRSSGSRSRSRSRSDSESGSDAESRRSESSAASSGDEGLDPAARDAARRRRQEEKRLKTTEVSSVADLGRARMTRSMLEELVFRENFRELAIGAYVRVGMVTGSTNSGGEKRPAYAIGEIVEVVESLKTYQLGSNFTNRAVKLRHYPHPFRLEYVSNSDWKPEEFEAYRNLVIRNGERLPTLFQVESKHRAIRDERTRPLDERGVAHLVAEKKRLAAAAGGGHAHVTNHTVRKHELVREREQAEMDGDASRAHQLAEQIARVEEEHTRKTRAAAQHLEAVARINERNRLRNRELEEAMRREYKEMKKSVDDPLARRPCRPQILTVRSAELLLSGMDAPSEQPAQPPPAPAPAPAAVDVVDTKTLPSNADVKPKNILSDAPSSTSGAAASLHGTPMKQDDLFSMHDFDLNLDDVPNVPLPTNLATVLHRPGASASAGRIKLPGYAASNSKLSATPTPHISAMSASRDRDSLDTKPDAKPGGILGTNPTVLKRLIGNRLSN